MASHDIGTVEPDGDVPLPHQQPATALPPAQPATAAPRPARTRSRPMARCRTTAPVSTRPLPRILRDRTRPRARSGGRRVPAPATGFAVSRPQAPAGCQVRA
jgi:hypothetical protein